jgi:hypothetical protein
VRGKRYLVLRPRIISIALLVFLLVVTAVAVLVGIGLLLVESLRYILAVEQLQAN